MKGLANIIPKETGRDIAGIALGWCASLGRDRLGAALLAFAARHGDVDLGIHEMTPRALVAALRRQELDLVILPGTRHPEFASRLLWYEPVGIALAPGHRLTQRQELTEDDLAEMLFLVPQDDRHGAVHRLLLEHIGPGVAAKSSMRAATVRQVEAEVASGAGTALFCGDWPGDRHEVVVRPLAPPRDRIAFYAQWHDRSRSPVLQELVSSLAAAADESPEG